FTLVQAFQYWIKLFALAVPAFILCAVFLGSAGGAESLGQPESPALPEETTVAIENDVLLQVGDPTPVQIHTETSTTTWWIPDTTYPVSAGTTLVFPAGAKVPVVADSAPDNASWLYPAEESNDLWWTYS